LLNHYSHPLPVYGVALSNIHCLEKH